MFFFLIVLCHDTGFFNSAELSLTWHQFQMLLFGNSERLETSDLQAIPQILKKRNSLFFFLTEKIVKWTEALQNILLVDNCLPHPFLAG